MGTRGNTLACGIACAMLVLGAGAARGADWVWTFTPYAWLADVSLDAEINDQEFVEGEVDAGDLIDDADFVGEAHFEGQRGTMGFFLDLQYFDFGDDDRVIDLPGPLDRRLIAKSDLEQTFLEAGGLWNPSGDGLGFALLYGARMVDIDQEIDARIEPGQDLGRVFDASETLFDGLVGARYLGLFNERWAYLVRGDASAGGTELTWNALAGVGYVFAGSGNAVWLGYRRMALEFESDDRDADIETEITMSGPITGFSFKF